MWLETLKTRFPDALPGVDVTDNVNDLLDTEGFDPDRTIFATSTCPDELNRTVTRFEESWGPAFHLGGLAGIPFTGQAGFDAFASHIPDNGRAVILYSSHVGISPDGELGRVIRRGQSHSTSSCGSAVGAYSHLGQGGKASDVDGQQSHVTALVERHLEEINSSDDPMAALPRVIYDAVDSELKRLIPADLDHEIALLGGIQINTPEDENDYFLVREFSVQRPAAIDRTSLLHELEA